MRIKYKLEKEDYLEFNLSQIERFPSLKRSINIQRFILPILLFILNFALYKGGRYSFQGLAIIYLVIAGIWIIFYPRYIQKSIRKRLERILSDEKNKSLLEEKILELREDGIYEVRANDKGEEESVFATDKVMELGETERNMHIYLNTESAYIIPKNYIEDQSEFRSIINSLINKEGA